MIRFVPHNEINKKSWDDCLDRAAIKHPYPYSWYLDTLCGEQWHALVEDGYRAVFPLPFRKKAGIAYIYTPFFVQQLGLYRCEPGPGSVDDFIRAIPSEYKLVELNLNSSNVATAEEYNYADNTNYELLLSRPYEEIAKGYSVNLHRNLKKAEKCGIRVCEGQNEEFVVRLFRSGKGKEVKHWKDREYGLFSVLLDACRAHAVVEVKEALDSSGVFIAGAVFVRFAGRAIFLFSSAGAQAKLCGAMAFLIDDYIRKNSGCPLILDFEGSNDSGLARFYASFGASRSTYQRLVKNALPRHINFVRKLVK